jgi:hypothetical protein
MRVDGRSLRDREAEIESEYQYQRMCQICEEGRLKRWRHQELEKLRMRSRLEVLEGGRSDEG